MGDNCINEDKLDLRMGYERTCDCSSSHINCLTAKEWLKMQLGVWRFQYEKRDIRDKNLHPAVFPLSLAARCINLFTHRGEAVLDPFNGSGTTLVAAQDLDRNAIGFDLKKEYIELSKERLIGNTNMFNFSKQIPILDDARKINEYIKDETLSLILTSPPYANLLNHKRTNKSRRNRKNEQYLKVEQYSQDSRDLGILDVDKFSAAFTEIFLNLYKLLKPNGHCVINVSDIWMDNTRIPLHITVVEAMQRAGFELRNTIIWDRTNLVNGIGIFGWPSNFITMGTTFEYILHFRKPKVKQGGIGSD